MTLWQLNINFLSKHWATQNCFCLILVSYAQCISFSQKNNVVRLHKTTAHLTYHHLQVPQLLDFPEKTKTNSMFYSGKTLSSCELPTDKMIYSSFHVAELYSSPNWEKSTFSFWPANFFSVKCFHISLTL